jgi:hypothetical protein
MAQQKDNFKIGIRTPGGQIVQAFDLCIKGDDSYVNYGDCSTQEAHGSYHASGQKHIKIGGQYVYWNGGPTGKWEPMKQFLPRPAEVTGRAEWFTIGWQVSRLDQVLPQLQGTPALIVDAQNLNPDAGVVLTVSVVGNAATDRVDILGFPLVALQQFGTAPCVEVAACVIDEAQLEAEDTAAASMGN